MDPVAKKGRRAVLNPNQVEYLKQVIEKEKSLTRESFGVAFDEFLQNQKDESNPDPRHACPLTKVSLNTKKKYHSIITGDERLPPMVEPSYRKRYELMGVTGLFASGTQMVCIYVCMYVCIHNAN